MLFEWMMLHTKMHCPWLLDKWRVRLPWLCCMGCPGYVVWVAVVMLHGLSWLCCMGCCGYGAWVAVVMLHGLPWLCCMGCRGYAAWVAVVMLNGLSWLCCMGCCGYVALPHESKVKPQVWPGWVVWQKQEIKRKQEGVGGQNTVRPFSIKSWE